jgi:hypothetical protein
MADRILKPLSNISPVSKYIRGVKTDPLPHTICLTLLIAHLLSLNLTLTHLTLPNLTCKAALITFPNERGFHSMEDSGMITICYFAEKRSWWMTYISDE